MSQFNGLDNILKETKCSLETQHCIVYSNCLSSTRIASTLYFKRVYFFWLPILSCREWITYIHQSDQIRRIRRITRCQLYAVNPTWNSSSLYLTNSWKAVFDLVEEYAAQNKCIFVFFIFILLGKCIFINLTHKTLHQYIKQNRKLSTKKTVAT